MMASTVQALFVVAEFMAAKVVVDGTVRFCVYAPVTFTFGVALKVVVLKPSRR